MSRVKKTTLFIKGMHCPSCDVLIKDKFSELGNIKDVKPDFRNLQAEVQYTGRLDKDKLNDKIVLYGYSISDHKVVEIKEPFLNRLMEGGTIAIILFMLYFFAQQLHILPEFNTAAGSSISYLTVFILGLVASTSTCMATSGALFMSTVGKLNNKDLSFRENILPAVSFNAGRVLSYGAFGFLVGLLGKTAAQSFQLGSFLTLFVALFMILIGLNMLKLISFSFLAGTSFTKGVFEKLESRLIKSPKKTAFFLGAITYLLPCGFTQSVQLYALGLANPVQSAIVMMIFAIGTIPALLAIGFASSFTRSSYYPLFSKVMGAIILIVVISYFSNFLSLRGISFNKPSARDIISSNVSIKDGYQEVKMTVTGRGYYPSYFTIKKNVPVKWVINGENVFGCQGFLQAPTLGIKKTLGSGNNLVEFTPSEKGPIFFSCSMGMFKGSFNVI